MFHDYLRDVPVSGIRRALVELFKILDQKPESRDKYLADDNPALQPVIFLLQIRKENHFRVAAGPLHVIHMEFSKIANYIKILDQKPESRDKYLADDNPALAAFPYVNGGLFSDEDIEIPPFTEELKTLLLENASEDFNWSDISPTIFGAVFESSRRAFPSVILA